MQQALGYHGNDQIALTASFGRNHYIKPKLTNHAKS